MSKRLLDDLAQQTEALHDQGLFKRERLIASPQRAQVSTADGRKVLNLCANNYLGLADDADLIASAKHALDERGFGMASVRFICGTQDIHCALEARLSAFLKTDATILFSSCFDANTGLFETILGEQDAIISDALNHASIIDGIRLCKARRYRYPNSDMAALEQALKESQDCRYRLIATDGVFSMDGSLANLPAICELAERYDALVMVDDSHAVGFMGTSGAGTPEHFGVQDRVDIVTGTLGKALGGASGGYVSGREAVVGWLRQRARPYLFSNSVAPMIVAATMTALDKVTGSGELRRRLFANAGRFRAAMSDLGFDLLPGEHPIIPVMLGDAVLAGRMAEAMLARGVYVVGFSFPVVPKGQARIRTQMSAALTDDDIDQAVTAFAEAGRELGILR